MKFIFKDWKTFIIFLVGGGLGSLLNVIITYALTEFIGFWYISSFIIGSFVNIIFNFIYHRSITFRVRDKIKSRVVKFLLLSVFSNLSITFLVYALTDILGFWYLFSVILAMIIISIINFSINRFWVFLEYEKN